MTSTIEQYAKFICSKEHHYKLYYRNWSVLIVTIDKNFPGAGLPLPGVSRLWQLSASGSLWDAAIIAHCFQLMAALIVLNIVSPPTYVAQVAELFQHSQFYLKHHIPCICSLAKAFPRLGKYRTALKCKYSETTATSSQSYWQYPAEQ